MAGPGWAPPRLDEFILTEPLGSGTYATVYKAYRKKDTREVVAIKCVNKRSLNRASVENLLTEIEILKTIRHPNIVELKDFQWDSDHIYLIMEFCAGGDLSRFIRMRRMLPEKVARVFLQQLACALKFLHDHNISHLDLKPQNILLSAPENPQLKLADFGFAQYMSPWDEKHVLRGSPLYMAPEMVCRQHYDARVDLWSVGVILYEALFGKPPFASRSFAELEEKIRSDRAVELPSRPQLSLECRDLLGQLLERDPCKRISFESFFAHPFVDMEHVPGPESLGKATDLVVEAVRKDQEGDAAAAFSLYRKALEYFVPALHYESDVRRKEAIRAKVRQYISRAEELKVLVTSSNKNLLEKGNPARELLKEMAKDKPRLCAALEVASAAIAKEEEGRDDSDALELYQQSLGELLLLLAAEPAGRRRELLHAEIQTLMARAEYLKDQIKVGWLGGLWRVLGEDGGWKMPLSPGRCGRHNPWARRHWQSPSGAPVPCSEPRSCPTGRCLLPCQETPREGFGFRPPHPQGWHLGGHPWAASPGGVSRAICPSRRRWLISLPALPRPSAAAASPGTAGGLFHSNSLSWLHGKGIFILALGSGRTSPLLFQLGGSSTSQILGEPTNPAGS